MKHIIIILALGFFTPTAFSQELKKVEEVTMQTSAICDDCKGRIEGALNYMKGVKFAELDNETKMVTIRYKTKKVSLAAIKAKISETGYDADEVKAQTAAVDLLPACCKPNVKPH